MITNELGNRTASIVSDDRSMLRRANREPKSKPKPLRRGMPDRVFRI
jgi:hypothetical protein